MFPFFRKWSEEVAVAVEEQAVASEEVAVAAEEQAVASEEVAVAAGEEPVDLDQRHRVIQQKLLE